jgi:hypothetical protein
MNSPLAQLGFVSLFHVIGGIAMGSALRGLRGGFSGGTLFLLVWGGMFGCMPLAIGANEFGRTGGPAFFAIELGVLIAAILVTALMPDTLLESLKSPLVAPIAVGGIFFAIGIGAGVLIAQTDLLPALLFGGCFAGAGALAFVSGLAKLLKS